MMKFTQHVVRRPWAYIGAVIVITLALGYQLRNLEMDPDITGSLPERIPAKRLYDKMGEIFPTKDMIFVGISGKNIFSLGHLEDVWDLTWRIERLDGVYDVLSPMNVKLIRGTEDGMVVEDILQHPPLYPDQIRDFRMDLFGSDLALGNLVSQDARMMGIMVLLKNSTDTDDFVKQFIPFIEERDSKTDLDYVLAGKPIATHYISLGMQRDMSTFFGGGLVLIFILLLVIFRTLRGILVPLAVVLLSVTWTLGMMALTGVPMSHATEVMPILIMSIAVADSIHIISHYYHNSRREQERRALILRTMEHMNSPVIMTSLTTMAGFLALGASGFSESTRLGVFTAVGVFFALLISLTFVPAILSLLKIPRYLEKRQAEQPWDARAAIGWGNLLVKYRKGLYPLVGVVALLAAIGISRLDHSYSAIENFPQDHPVRMAYDLMNVHFAGTTDFQVVIEGEEEDLIKEPRILRDMDELKRLAVEHPHVGDAMSLADWVKRMHKVLNGDREEYYTIPPERVAISYMDWEERNGQWVEVEKTDTVSGKELVAQYLALYEMSGKPEDLANMVDYGYRNAKLSIFLNTDNMTDLRAVDAELNEFIAGHFEGTSTAVTGMAKLTMVIDGLIVSGQIISVCLSLFLVWLITSIMFKSPLLGFFNTLPLFFALLLNFTIMGLTGIHVNLETMMISSITIGVGVDYAIHFIYTYRRRLAREGTYDAAVPSTMEDSGIAIAYNSFIVAAGFSIIALSQFVAIMQMGVLITLTMLTSAFGALTILPLLFVNFQPRALLPKNNAAAKEQS